VTWRPPSCSPPPIRPRVFEDLYMFRAKMLVVSTKGHAKPLKPPCLHGAWAARPPTAAAGPRP
jgi:hypothetical protein